MSAQPAKLSETESARSAEGFWPHEVVSPQRNDYDAGRLRFGWKELTLIIGLSAAMIGQQWRLQSTIDNIATKVDGFKDLQTERFLNMQREFDELKREEKMNRVYIDELKSKGDRLEGMVIGLKNPSPR